jgi:hypothetical protein
MYSVIWCFVHWWKGTYTSSFEEPRFFLSSSSCSSSSSSTFTSSSSFSSFSSSSSSSSSSQYFYSEEGSKHHFFLGHCYISMYHTTHSHFPEDCNASTFCYEILKSHTTILYLYFCILSYGNSF